MRVEGREPPPDRHGGEVSSATPLMLGPPVVGHFAGQAVYEGNDPSRILAAREIMQEAGL